jgi:hypothetical protein
VRASFSVALSIWLSLAAGAVGSGCGGDDCLENVDVACTPLYEPTFANIYANTLTPSCAVGGASCHSAAGSAGGMSFEGANQAFAALHGDADGERRVIAGDPACSLLIQRLEADSDNVMPPGKALPAAERCAIIKWVNEGAKR